MHLYYATRDGQTRRIAERIATRLREAGVAAELTDLAVQPPDSSDLAERGPFILIAAVRYGRHLRQAEHLLASYRALAAPPPLYLLSVNLTARKPGKTTAPGNTYLRRTIEKYRLDPKLAGAIAGRLDYPSYTWIDRQMIRLIMVMTRGPTDPSAQIEFTDWAQVDALARRIAELCGGATPPDESPRPAAHDAF